MNVHSFIYLVTFLFHLSVPEIHVKNQTAAAGKKE